MISFVDDIDEVSVRSLEDNIVEILRAFRAVAVDVLDCSDVTEGEGI